MNNPIGQFTDEFTNEVIKGIPKAAKAQILGSNEPTKPTQDKKLSPVTGKPVPSKQAMSQLSQATASLQMTKLQQVRKRLEEMRLKVTENKPLAGVKGTGPEMSTEKPKPKDNIVEQTLKNAQSTGEIRGGGG